MEPIPAATYFNGVKEGLWRIDGVKAVRGDNALPQTACLSISAAPSGEWTLRGIQSYERYVHKTEQQDLQARQPPLGRPAALSAVLIPIRKTAAWWSMAQDERRRIFEDQSHHIRIGGEYLPAIARRLYHSRDLGEAFDFLTWFEFAPGDTSQFDDLLGRLRASDEWRYVDREFEIRLTRKTTD